MHRQRDRVNGPPRRLLARNGDAGCRQSPQGDDTPRRGAWHRRQQRGWRARKLRARRRWEVGVTARPFSKSRAGILESSGISPGFGNRGPFWPPTGRLSWVRPLQLSALVEEGPAAFVVQREALAALPAVLRARGYLVVGPVVREGAVVLEELRSLEDLPRGWADDQAPGAYRLRRREDGALFGFAVGPQSPKCWFHPADALVFRARRSRAGTEIAPNVEAPPKLALFGARACDLAAIAVQDRVLREGPAVDSIYDSRRRDCFVVAVNCTEPARTCFCVSTGTGPCATAGFDLALTELIDEVGHRFIVTVGSPAGRRILAELHARPAGTSDVESAHAAHARAASEMKRAIDPVEARGLLARNAESPVWEEIADRCLACGNCTMVCPTCFCTTVDDVADLTGDHAERWRRWDSCFTFQFSHLNSGVVRAGTSAQYRHWLTHKLSGWNEQFGQSGCVGCGRCITWCPVGIDLTEELVRIREREDRPARPEIHA